MLRKQKTILFLFLLFFLLFSCTSKNKKAETVVHIPVEETVNDPEAVHPDTLLMDTIQVVEEVNIDTVFVDEFFDDFIFNYASDEKLRLTRTVSPLPYYENDTPLKIEKEDWVIDSLFFGNDYYTLLIDEEEELDLVDGDNVSPSSVQVEWYYREPAMAVKYYFEKIGGGWMLEGVHSRPIAEAMNKDFIEFFFKFGNDSIFQSEHIHYPLIFVTTDPDDDFAIIETTLDLNQWHAFKPVLPAEIFSNINYGQHNEDKSPHKIVQLKGIGNGFLNTLYFRRKVHSWELYKFEDTSN